MKADIKRIVILLGLAVSLSFFLFIGCFHDVDDESEETEEGVAAAVTYDNEAAHLEFISAEPAFIALKYTGGPGRSETSVLYFKVTGENGDPVEGQKVNFELSTDVGNLYLSNSEDKSDASGLVKTTVNSGTMPTHIRVKATIAGSNPEISIVSDELLVSTGLPDQNSIVMHPKPHNPETLYYDNVEVPVTFQAADHFNNFVPDGTVVYFTTEGGSIDDSCVLENGVCEVTWRSGPPWPSDGMITILAFCLGEESFTDYNGNGYFDGGDVFDESTDMAEPFRDDDDNGIHTPGEPWWDDDNGLYGQFDGTANGIYNGTLCSDDAEDAGLCTKELIYAQFKENIVNSGSFANISFSKNSLDLTDGTVQSVNISIQDTEANPMPCDTKVSISTTVGEIMGGSSYKIPDTLSAPTVITVSLKGESTGDIVSGVLTVEVETPMGNKSPIASLPVTGREE